MKTFKIAFLALGLISTAVFAGGSKAPGSGSFKNLSNVRADGSTQLKVDGKDEYANLGNPVRAAFTKKDGNSFLLIRNSDSKNFRFDLPNNIYIGNIKQPRGGDLENEGDTLVVRSGATGQNMTLRVHVKDRYYNRSSYDTTESCTITRTREVRRTRCWRDDEGRRQCKTYWETETYYIPGERDVTRVSISQSDSYEIRLLSASGGVKMDADLNYSDSSSYTTNTGRCYAY